MILGSSYVARTADFLERVGRTHHLPLPARFRGVPGLRLSSTRRTVDDTLHLEGKGFVILHVGANDIGSETNKNWLIELEELLFYIKARYPGYRPIWSDMLPRKKWRHLRKNDAEKRRRRLQRRARGLFLSEGGDVIRHPILTYNDDFVSSDNVHLGLMGQEIFIMDFAAYSYK